MNKTEKIEILKLCLVELIEFLREELGKEGFDAEDIEQGLRKDTPKLISLLSLLEKIK